MRMTSSARNDNRSPFQELGGFSTIRTLVIDFYERVLDSDVVGHHFENVAMRQLIDHQTKFLAGLLGGPASIDTGRIARAHRHLKITDAEFDEVRTLLCQTLQDGGVDLHARMHLMALVEQLRPSIVMECAA